MIDSAALGVTRQVTAVFEALGVAYVIGGSLASMVHGMMRTTMDADIIADLQPGHAAALVAALGEAFYVPDEALLRQAIERRGSFNLIHLATMFKVDVFVPQARPFDRQQLARRIAGGRRVRRATVGSQPGGRDPGQAGGIPPGRRDVGAPVARRAGGGQGARGGAGCGLLAAVGRGAAGGRFGGAGAGGGRRVRPSPRPSPGARGQDPLPGPLPGRGGKTLSPTLSRRARGQDPLPNPLPKGEGARPSPQPSPGGRGGRNGGQ